MGQGGWGGMKWREGGRGGEYIANWWGGIIFFFWGGGGLNSGHSMMCFLK